MPNRSRTPLLGVPTPDVLRKRVAQQVFRYRTALNMTQGELAALIETKQPAIARLEAGENDIRLETLLRLSIALRCRPEQLLWGWDTGRSSVESPRERIKWSVVKTTFTPNVEARRFEIGPISHKNVA